MTTTAAAANAAVNPAACTAASLLPTPSTVLSTWPLLESAARGVSGDTDSQLAGGGGAWPVAAAALLLALLLCAVLLNTAARKIARLEQERKAAVEQASADREARLAATVAAAAAVAVAEGREAEAAAAAAVAITAAEGREQAAATAAAAAAAEGRDTRSAAVAAANAENLLRGLESVTQQWESQWDCTVQQQQQPPSQPPSPRAPTHQWMVPAHLLDPIDMQESKLSVVLAPSLSDLRKNVQSAFGLRSGFRLFYISSAMQLKPIRSHNNLGDYAAARSAANALLLVWQKRDKAEDDLKRLEAEWCTQFRKLNGLYCPSRLR